MHRVVNSTCTRRISESLSIQIFIGVHFAKYNMQPEFVIVKADVYMKWGDHPPRYRCYIGDELFTERTWIWRDVYLEEQFQIQAPPGKYPLRVELVDSEHGSLKVRNLRVDTGPAIISKDGFIQIYTPERHNEG